jgi:hypothetical protein
LNKLNNIVLYNTNFIWISLGGFELASSRLRCYYIHEEFKRYANSTIQGGKFIKNQKNVIITQKNFSYKTLLKLIIYKLKSSVIIIDIDDFKSIKDEYWINRIKIFAMLSDLITVATMDQMKYVDLIVNNQKVKKNIYILENSIDYKEQLNYKIDSKKQNEDKIRIGWFGNSGNLVSIIDDLEYLKSKYKDKVEIVIISDEFAKQILSQTTIVDKIIIWSYKNFINNLINNIDICILNHAATDISKIKSANKMIVCLSVGIPVIFSKTQDYINVSMKYGIEDYVYNNKKSLFAALEKLKDPKTYLEYINKTHDLVRTDYSTEAIAKKYLLEINKLKSKSMSVNEYIKLIRLIIRSFYLKIYN